MPSRCPTSIDMSAKSCIEVGRSNDPVVTRASTSTAQGSRNSMVIPGEGYPAKVGPVPGGFGGPPPFTGSVGFIEPGKRTHDMVNKNGHGQQKREPTAGGRARRSSPEGG